MQERCLAVGRGAYILEDFVPIFLFPEQDSVADPAAICTVSDCHHWAVLSGIETYLALVLDKETSLVIGPMHHLRCEGQRDVVTVATTVFDPSCLVVSCLEARTWVGLRALWKDFPIDSRV